MDKIKIHFTSAHVGAGYRYSQMRSIPPQENDKYDLELVCYDDYNTPPMKNLLHPRTKSRMYRTLDWMKYDADYYVWFDASFTLKSKNLGDVLLENLGDSDICLYKHMGRDTVHQELSAVTEAIRNKNGYCIDRYDGQPMEEMVEFFHKDPTWKDNVLFNVGFFIFRKDVVENRNYNLMTDWFLYNCMWTVEDQLILPYLIHKHNLKYSLFKDGKNVYDNPILGY